MERYISEKSTAPFSPPAVLYCDGSCPKANGPMGIGYKLVIGPKDLSVGLRLGNGTNNQAEYLALIYGLREALRSVVTHITIYTDSQLMQRQLEGKYQVLQFPLTKLHEEASGLLKMFVQWNIIHVRREKNQDADSLSKNPTTTEDTLVEPVIELGRGARKLNREQAAMCQWWWDTERCTNEYRLSRIFGMVPSAIGKVARGDTYEDIRERDLPHDATTESPLADLNP